MEWHEIFSLLINAVSAIGTFGAAAIALCLALQGRQQRIDCAFMWEAATDDKPTLILNNIGRHTVIVKKVTLYFHKEEIGCIDILGSRKHCESAIIAPEKGCRISLDVDCLKMDSKSKPAQNPDKIYTLTAIVESTTKRKYKSSYKYCYHDILGLYFAAGFNE